MNSYNPMECTSPAFHPPSNKSPSTSTESPRLGLSTIAEKCRETQGILTPTETLELLDIAETCYSTLQDARDELACLEWDLTHPTSKYL